MTIIFLFSETTIGYLKFIARTGRSIILRIYIYAAIGNYGAVPLKLNKLYCRVIFCGSNRLLTNRNTIPTSQWDVNL